MTDKQRKEIEKPILDALNSALDASICERFEDSTLLTVWIDGKNVHVTIHLDEDE